MKERILEGDRHVLGMTGAGVSEGYPPKLMYLYPPVREVYAIGDIAVLDTPSVALLGPREADGALLALARDLVVAAMERGLAVVSAWLPGFDGAVLAGTVELGGKAVAVTAEGLGRRDAGKDHALLQDVVDSGGVAVSTQEWDVPRRPIAHEGAMRLTAGLADVTVVCGVDDLSTLSTPADSAISMYRPAFMIPSARAVDEVDGDLSRLKHGAAIVVSGADELASALDRLPIDGRVGALLR